MSVVGGVVGVVGEGFVVEVVIVLVNVFFEVYVCNLEVEGLVVDVVVFCGDLV